MFVYLLCKRFANGLYFILALFTALSLRSKSTGPTCLASFLCMVCVEVFPTHLQHLLWACLNCIRVILCRLPAARHTLSLGAPCRCLSVHCVDRRRYRHFADATQLDVELSCFAINGPLDLILKMHSEYLRILKLASYSWLAIGVLIDGELSMRQHVTRLAQTCFFHLRSLRRQLGRDVMARLVWA